VTIRAVEVVAIEANGPDSLVLTRGGDVMAWGTNGDGQANVPADLRDVVAVSAGFIHSLAVTRSGAVVAWGAYTTFPSALMRSTT